MGISMRHSFTIIAPSLSSLLYIHYPGHSSLRRLYLTLSSSTYVSCSICLALDCILVDVLHLGRLPSLPLIVPRTSSTKMGRAQTEKDAKQRVGVDAT
jgi:hypothetical protein